MQIMIINMQIGFKASNMSNAKHNFILEINYQNMN